jgi:glycerol kinase
MSTDYIGAIDQGTTSTRFLVFDSQGNETARAQEEHDQILPLAGWVEQDPMQILKRTHSVILRTLQRAKTSPASIHAIGITNQRETTVVWNPKTGIPWYNAIVWQDTRTLRKVQELESKGLSEIVRQKTGLPISTYFSALKIQWILENVPGVAEASHRGEAVFGTIDSWLIWNLTGGAKGGLHVTDVTNASRTLLMDLQTLQWDEDLLRIFGIPQSMLPKIEASSDPSAYGFSSFDSIFPESISIAGILGDQQAALIGQACFDSGETKNTYGTGSFLLMNTGIDLKPSVHGLLTTCAYQCTKEPAHYALEGAIAITGSAVQWLRDQLKIIANASEVEALANSVPDNGGVYFVPAFSGLFAPYWRGDARGTIVGLTRHSSSGHIARATLEAICYQTQDVLLAMEADSKVRVSQLKVDGGATVNETLMQLQANVLGIPVLRPANRETTALGAAIAAGIATGFWKDKTDLKRHWKVEKVWEPQWGTDQREAGYHHWKKAIERSLGWL